MILREFPDHKRAGFDTGGSDPKQGWPNMVIKAVGHDVSYTEHSGPLSIKCAFGGREYYRVDGTTMAADDEGFVVLNEGQIYSSRIPSGPPVESFCVFFHSAFVHDVLSSQVRASDLLLSHATRHGLQQPVTFFDRRYRYTPAISRRIGEMRRGIENGVTDNTWLEASLRSLLVSMLTLHRGLRSEIESLNAVRVSTRAELYRRLCHARDVIESLFHQPLTVHQLAEVAYLSPHHFLRQFKQLFGETPHQMLRRRRLEEARRLLRARNDSVADICHTIGFESTGSFTTLFARTFGVPPDQWRRRRR